MYLTGAEKTLTEMSTRGGDWTGFFFQINQTIYTHIVSGDFLHIIDSICQERDAVAVQNFSFCMSVFSLYSTYMCYYC